MSGGDRLLGIEDVDPRALRQRLSRTMLRTVAEHALIEDGDRILVAVSGGKDSYTMLDLLDRARPRAPVGFELIAFHLDQAQPGYDGAALCGWLERSGVTFEIVREDTYSVVIERAASDPGAAYCRVCSRLRRGIVYRAAERLGCNKVALGHHRDDALETLLLNLFYAGRLQAMPAIYTTNDGRFRVIRPLIECAESDIARHAAQENFPILPCNLCGSQAELKRREVAQILEQLERRIPNLRQVMLAALKNVRPSHLLDADVAEAWSLRAASYAPRR
ncbi:MAG TPA: tRNA 2-thiocytidine(32) synthetase TtcA [Candidatus Polarisedimenticolaceae bacterium]|nr:tRNA 2-thiocytidine(32) synthetase TtcA [Candidatus Polarisedimenticolaceae bacterium]